MTDYTDASWSADDLEFKAVTGQLNVDEAQGIVECFVAAVGNKDSVGDIVAHGAFDGSLRRRKPRVVWGHDWNQPIGKVLAIEEVPSSDSRLPEKMQAARVGGLLARVQFNLKSERGREAFYSVAFFGTDQEWSIGYKTIKATYDPAAQANVLQEVELFEVSPVLHGANQLTGTISIKSAYGDVEMDELEPTNGVKSPTSEWSDWADEDESWEMPEDDESPAENLVGPRRVRMVVGENGIGEIHSGSNRHQVSLDELNNDGSSVNGEDRPGLGNAVSKAVNSSIQLRITQPNFVIFDMADEDNDVDTFFMPYHYDAQGEQYMFGDPMEVEVEMNVKFGMGSDEEYESEGKSAYDPALSADDFEDLEEKGLLGRIGRGVGRGDNPLRGRNPKDVVDRNNDGWLFSGPNRIRAVDRTGPDAGGQAGIDEDLNIGMERLKRIALADRKKPAKKPSALTSNRMEKPSYVRPKDGIIRPKDNPRWKKPSADKPAALKLWEFDHREINIHAPIGSRNPVFTEQRRNELLRAAKLEDRTFIDEGRYEGLLSGAKPLTLTSNRMEKPGKGPRPLSYPATPAERARAEAADAAGEARREASKVARTRNALLRDRQDFEKVKAVENLQGESRKAVVKIPDAKNMVLPANSKYDIPEALSPNIEDHVKVGDVVTFGEPGTDAMSTGVVRKLDVSPINDEDGVTSSRVEDLTNNPHVEIYVTHHDGVPIAESQRHTVTAGGEPDGEPGPDDVHMDLGELVNGLHVFKGK